MPTWAPKGVFYGCCQTAAVFAVPDDTLVGVKPVHTGVPDTLEHAGFCTVLTVEALAVDI